MKHILLSVVLVFTTALSTAAEYTFKFSEVNGVQRLEADLSKMQDIGEATKWTLHAHLGNYNDNKNFVILHSLTEFRVEERTDINNIKFQRIYTYGFVDCRKKELTILNEWYTTMNDLVVLDNRFSQGEYQVDLTRNIVMEMLQYLACKVEPT